MNTPLSILTLAIFFTLPWSVYAQQPTVPYFKAICVSEKATGFNWSKGDWIQVNFTAGERLLVEKLNPAAYASKPVNEKPIMCKEEPDSVSGNFVTAKGCYLISEMGKSKYMFEAEMCEELLIDGKLFQIECSKLTFLPEGSFIKTPDRLEIGTQPKDDYKDSLVLAVGKCSKLED